MDGTTYPYCYTDVKLDHPKARMVMRIGRDLAITVGPGSGSSSALHQPHATTVATAFDGDGNHLGIVAEWLGGHASTPLVAEHTRAAIAAAAHLWPDHYTGNHPAPPRPACRFGCDPGCPHPPFDPPIQQYLDLSTSHMPSADRAGEISSYDGVIVEKRAYGFWVWVPDDVNEHNSDYEGFPVYLHNIQVYARQLGCNWLCFDIDGRTIDDLPTWDR